MKKTTLIVILFLFLIIVTVASGCSSGNISVISKTGTMKHIELNGWFYGIVSDDGKGYEVTNLDSTFQQDNLRVRFDAKILENAESIHMWGTIIEVTNIEKIKGDWDKWNRSLRLRFLRYKRYVPERNDTSLKE